MPDKYTATWVSHSSLGDWLRCPRLYYLRNVYKDPVSGHKVNVVSPALALGLAVHEALESLHQRPAERRFDRPMADIFGEAWEAVAGKKGGFTTAHEEAEVKARGLGMVERVERSPGPLANKTIRMNQDLPYYYLSEDANIILCGKVDWLEYLPAEDAVHVIDFKTGQREERADSLQLPIYALLLKHCQKRHVAKASYWYLQREDAPTVVDLPDLAEAYERVIDAARRVKRTREDKAYSCPRGEEGCYACWPFEKILRGEAEPVGVGSYQQDLYAVR